MADRQKIKQIHDNTDFKTEFAGITQDGEFIYDFSTFFKVCCSLL